MSVPIIAIISDLIPLERLQDFGDSLDVQCSSKFLLIKRPLKVSGISQSRRLRLGHLTGQAKFTPYVKTHPHAFLWDLVFSSILHRLPSRRTQNSAHQNTSKPILTQPIEQWTAKQTYRSYPPANAAEYTTIAIPATTQHDTATPAAVEDAPAHDSKKSDGWLKLLGTRRALKEGERAVGIDRLRRAWAPLVPEACLI